MGSSEDVRGVLLEFWGATNGTSWLSKSRWNTDASISTWYGVTVDENGSVAKLELRENRLQGTLPESLGKMSKLTVLWLGHNRLRGAIPDSLAHLSNLTLLWLGNNQLEGTIPDSLGRLFELTYLWLGNNALKGTIPESLGQLSNLTLLVLENNQLRGAIPESLGELPKLTYLNLAKNKLSGAIPESLGKLSSLRHVYLDNNQLSGAIPESFRQLSNLVSLILHKNQLSGTIPESLGELPNLMNLYLSSNQFSGISEEAAKGLQRLRTRKISLEDNPWGNPPADIVNGGLERIVGYWEAIKRSGAIMSWKLKVVLVGAVKAGKTSLVKGMLHGKPQLCHEEDRTKGVDVHVDEPCKPDAERKIEFIFWDFAGHSEYYSTHQIFLSKGALHLLAVDLKRFSEEPSAKGDLVDVWLDALQCRVPGSSVLVVATQIDRFAGDIDAAVGNLQHTVEAHLSAKREELERARRNSSASLGVPPGLVFHGVKTVSSARSDSLVELRLKLSSLVYTNRGMFPSVGRLLPVSWVRVTAMLIARRSGKDPILEASRVGAVEQNQGKLEVFPAGTRTTGADENFLHRAAAMEEWDRVVRTLKLEKEVGSTVWDRAVRVFKRSEDTERRGKSAVFEDAVGQLVEEGMILDSGEVLYLEPSWINNLVRAILDHDLANVTKEKFWKDKLEEFTDGNTESYWDLKKIHDNFPSTGILTIRYLRFLWRDVTEIGDGTLFQSLLGIMSRNGIIFKGNPSEANRENARNTLDDSTQLLVPLHLPTNILESDLEEFSTLLKSQFHKELVYEIRQTYVPPGVLGLLMARILTCKGVQFRKCWSRGAAFTLGEVFVLLHLDTPSTDEDEARVTVNLFGERFVSKLSTAMDRIEHEIKSMFVERFSGLLIGPKHGYPRDVEGVHADDRMNAIVERIGGLEEHLDRELSHLLQELRKLEGNLHDMAKTSRMILARINKLQSEEVPCPRLLIVRPAAARVSGEKKRSLWAMMEGLGRRAKRLVCKDMRLCFICPYDFSEVPCGLDGNGYPFTMTREWVTKISPALKVTAVLAKVAIKAASGLDLPVSDFLNGAKSYLGEELADRVLDDGAVEQALEGSSKGGGEGEVQMLVGKSYEEVKQFVDAHESKCTGDCINFDQVMQLVDDGHGGRVWVSNENIKLWEDSRA